MRLVEGLLRNFGNVRFGAVGIHGRVGDVRIGVARIALISRRLRRSSGARFIRATTARGLVGGRGFCGRFGIGFLPAGAGASGAEPGSSPAGSAGSGAAGSSAGWSGPPELSVTSDESPSSYGSAIAGGTTPNHTAVVTAIDDNARALRR